MEDCLPDALQDQSLFSTCPHTAKELSFEYLPFRRSNELAFDKTVLLSQISKNLGLLEGWPGGQQGFVFSSGCPGVYTSQSVSLVIMNANGLRWLL